tara:strand:- start:190 stop:1143 length:954 start_codon:yes stop_codon:yes gene_type:complete
MPDYGGPSGFGGSGGGEAATGGPGGSGYGGMSRGQNQKGTKYSPSLAKAINNVALRAQAKKMETLQQQAALEAIQQAEHKQVSPTQSSISSMVNSQDQERAGLLSLAKKNKITNEQLNKLADMNEAIGLNPTTGMGLIESFRNNFSHPSFKSDVSNAINTYKKYSPLGMLFSGLTNVFNPQYSDEPEGIAALDDVTGYNKFSNQLGTIANQSRLKKIRDSLDEGVMPAIGVKKMTPMESIIQERGLFEGPIEGLMKKAELTDEQKSFMNQPMQSTDFQSADSLFDKVKQMEDTGFFGIGAQEPTTREEFDAYLSTII